jgi:hypothetical protein
MKRVTKIILTKEQSEKFLKAKEESKKKIRDTFPPKEVMEFMRTKAEETNKLNKGKLNKSTFMLGMMAMWSYMDKQNKKKTK